MTMSKHETISKIELLALIQCVMTGASRKGLIDALLSSLETGLDTASPRMPQLLALRSVSTTCVLPKVSLYHCVQLL